MRRVNKGFSRLVLFFLTLFLLTAGCSAGASGPAQPGTAPGTGAPEPPATTAPPEAKEVAHIALPAGPLSFTSETLSPDGKRAVILATQGGEKEELWLFSIPEGKGHLLATVETEAYQAGHLFLRSLGWTEEGRLVFARQGTQPEGPHQGQRGIAFYTAAPADPEPREVGWLGTANQYVHEVYPNLKAGEIFVHVGGTLWRLSLKGEEPRPLRKNLPSYDGLFYPRLSPDGAYFAYELWEPGQSGIYVLPTTGASETCLAARGETMSFFPQWSPDGRHLAYYTAGPKGQGADPYDKYDVLPGEDGPLPVAEAIDVSTPAGNKVAHLTVPGYKLAGFVWSQDGRYLAFVAGKPQPQDNYLEVPLAEQSLWLADLSGDVTKVAELPDSSTATVLPVTVAPSGQGVYYLVRSEEETTLWLARAGQEPQRLTLPETGPGHFWPDYPLNVMGDSFFLTHETSGNRILVQVWGDKVMPVLPSQIGTGFIAGISGRRLAYISEGADDRQGELVVLEFTP